MKRIHSSIKIADRAGVTLTEVLMSLMIMAIGVSSVAVLFPISMLRSLEATQLTNGAILKRNVETILDSNPDLIFDPDGDGEYFPHFQNPSQRNYVVDPAAFYTLASDGAGFEGVFGNNGSNTKGVPRFGGGLTTLTGLGFDFNNVAAPQNRPITLAAETISSMGDRWETVADVAVDPSTYTNGVFTFPDSHPAYEKVTDVPQSSQLVRFDGSVSPSRPYLPDPERFQVVVFDEDGRTVAYPLLHISFITNPIRQAKIFFTEDLNENSSLDDNEDFNANGVLNQRGLPADFGTPQRLLLQAQRINDFRWMLNVRRRGDGAVRNVDIVVKVSDGVDPTEERGFDATFIGGSTQVGIVSGADGVVPNIRKGKFIFDAGNAIWYRISDVRELTGDPYDFRVTLETAAQASYGSDASDGALDGDDMSSLGFALFPKGIVDVYPTGPREFPTR